MDFAFTADERAFAEEVRRFLRAQPLESFPLEGMDAGYGSGAHSRAFMRALGARGLAQHGLAQGLRRPGAPAVLQARAAGRAGAGRRAVRAARRLLADRGRHHRATAASACGARCCRRWRAATATFWQGYSEPGAGSDLLALKTEARRDGDDYVIRGHKIWSSHAGIATYGLVFARTSREARRSRGFSMFVVPNGTPGMDIRPIRSLTGEVYHYEIFLDDVRVPADMRSGPEGEGFSRAAQRSRLRPVLGTLLQGAGARSARCASWSSTPTPRAVRGVPLARDPAVRRRLADVAVEIAALARALLPRGVPHARRGDHHLRDRAGQGDGRRDRPEDRAARHGPARAVGTAARGLARGQARRIRSRTAI